ncbi:DUF1611 domain-containing protein [Exilibacterium tricleocarpae]|uniref:DUF1611 domain-containing protein n=1 Tax=Exilibacterium tricleocarpae TaxID=2591008 RepID=A0A545SQJ0_9GAMM|nr:DUF1611 domain-containing protein [Exilibacterium tricleocarpae]TQV67243.1 DUF1611 domain-containing protein [Exilibacterium tricleocarpae]
MAALSPPYLLFLGDSDNPLSIKIARGLAHWRPELCIGETGGELSLGLKKMTPAQGARAGAKTFIVGLANGGGYFEPSWVGPIIAAIEAGMDIASGMHQKLSDHKEIRQAAQKHNVSLHDIRHTAAAPPLGTGVPRSGKRLLTVGTDCSVGKMYTALAIEKAMKQERLDVDFRATGQTGIFIAGGGIPVDAVIADFIAGAVEQLSPPADPGHWDVIEGQGSLFNPAFAGVSLGLLHGAQADILVMCHEAGRTQVKDMPGFPVPTLKDCIDTNLHLARLTNPAVKLGAIALNCRVLGAERADKHCAALSEQFAVPCFDPLLHGAGALAESLAGKEE